jgi:hypothetical protein
MKSTLQQAKDNSKHLSNLTVNTARTFEQNSRRITEAVSEDNSSNNDFGNNINTTTYSNIITTAKKAIKNNLMSTPF